MKTYFKNLNLQSVKYGFGWRYNGDMSTHPIGNILQDLDYKFEKLYTENCKLQNELAKFKQLGTAEEIEQALTAASYSVEQWKKERAQLISVISKCQNEAHNYDADLEGYQIINIIQDGVGELLNE